MPTKTQQIENANVLLQHSQLKMPTKTKTWSNGNVSKTKTKNFNPKNNKVNQAIEVTLK